MLEQIGSMINNYFNKRVEYAATQRKLPPADIANNKPNPNDIALLRKLDSPEHIMRDTFV